VRYDGRERRDSIVADQLARRFELVPVCPEVGIGLPVPRDPVELRGSPEAPRMTVIATGVDLTPRMDDWIAGTLAALDDLAIAGLILKGRSPSCGPDQVPVAREGAGAVAGTGMFALAARLRWPGLPLVEAEALGDPALHRAFVEQVVAAHDARHR
jgi:uncharacterized protein YbbK (DUF523 family)